jgi:hypothetical protein
MALKILAAGIDKDARARVEATVKHALAWRTLSESWTVSLVKLGGRWSVTLNGPGDRYRNLSFVADDSGLGEAITGVLEGGAPESPASVTTPSSPPSSSARGVAPAAAPAVPAVVAAGEVKEAHGCQHCQMPFVVIYEAQAGEDRALVSVACPHCWKTNHVEIGAWAAAGREFRAEKA